jgi:hypothetical protein
MNADIQQIKQVREAERRRLRELPWPEKLELLDKLRDRHLWLRQMRREIADAAQERPGITESAGM